MYDQSKTNFTRSAPEDPTNTAPKNPKKGRVQISNKLLSKKEKTAEEEEMHHIEMAKKLLPKEMA